MTLPVKRAFKNSRGFQAAADVSINSPRTNNSQTNQQNVNVNIVSPLTKDREIIISTDETEIKPEILEFDKQEIDLVENQIIKPPQTDDIDIKERSIESAMINLEEMNGIIKDKNCLIQALALIIDLYESNPLIINKFIVAEEEVLIKLLLLLTDGDEIEIVKKDEESGCLCKIPKYSFVNKIIVHKGNDIYNLKYSFPNIVRLLNNRHISYKIVC